MLDFKQIQELIKLVNKTNMREVKIEKEDFKLLIRSEHYTKGQEGGVAPSIISTNLPIQNIPVAAPMPSAVPETAAPPPAPVEKTQAKDEASEAPAPPALDTAKLIEIKSPMIGTFYRSPSPDKPPFIKVGDTIEEGSVLCIVEAMKLFNEIESEVSGTIVKVLAEDASPVEYDTPLFLVDPS